MIVRVLNSLNFKLIIYLYIYIFIFSILRHIIFTIFNLFNRDKKYNRMMEEVYANKL